MNCKRQTPQAERRTAGTSYATFAQAEVDQPRGRFEGQTPQHVVGSTPAPEYPAGPAWSQDQLPDEPPLGEEPGGPLMPVGTHAEIAQSLIGGACEDTGFPPIAGALDSASPDDVRSASSASDAPSPPSKRKRRKR